MLAALETDATRARAHVDHALELSSAPEIAVRARALLREIEAATP